MKFLIIFALVFIKFCDSNDFKCGYLDDEKISVEFYCEHFQESFPVNCTTTSLYLISSCDKSKVLKLKIGGCDENRISQLVDDFQNIRSLDISYSGLESVKPLNRKLDHLEKLDVSHNRLSENPRVFCAQMPRLTEVNFSYNEFSHVSGLPDTLKRIDLSHNNMSSISYSDLTNVPYLEYFDISHNTLKEINHSNIFLEAKHLKTFRLEDNRYETFDQKFILSMRRGVAIQFSWKYVTTFGIDENLGKPIRIIINSQAEGIRSTPDGKFKFHCHEGNFENIKIFSFTNNHIENTGDMIRCLTPTLEELTLSGHFNEKLNLSSLERFDILTMLTLTDGILTKFDFKSLKNLRKLRKLDISRNHLKRIKNIQYNPRPYIYVLNLSGNYVGQLNASTLDKFTYLRELYLSNTSLSVDDLTPFESLDRLEKLDISYNNLNNTNFTSKSRFLKDITQFSAAHCNIANVSDLLKLFGRDLIQIDLSGNPLGVLENITFENVTYLKLNLSHANLSHISFDFEYVWRLDLSNNNLKSVNLTSIKSWLLELDLSGNELTEVDQFTTSQFPDLGQISISNNQIPCKRLSSFISEWQDWKLADNPLKQKHGDCSHVIRLLNNLGFVGGLITEL